MLAGFGLFLIGMAVLQAWPGRGFWQGHVGQPARHPDRHGRSTMAQTPQPHALASLVSGFGTLARDHGFAVNLVAVTVLAVIGVAFLTGVTGTRPSPARRSPRSPRRASRTGC